MTDIYFYHLERQTTQDLLPVLLGKVLERHWKALVVCRGHEEMNQLNEYLWTFSPDSFLPHGTAFDGFPETQPVLLTTQLNNTNNAETLILFLNTDEETQQLNMGSDLSIFQRVMIPFYTDEEKQIARKAWTAYKTAGYNVSYWRQDFSGRWQKQA